MAETVFTYQIKTVECTKCGGPVTTSKEGGQARCEYCGASITVTARPREERQQTQIDETARLAGLSAQAKSMSDEHALIRIPDELVQFQRMLADPGTRQAGQEAFRQEWEKARRRMASASASDVEAGTHLFRLAIAIADQHGAESDDRRARATLETALDLVSDTDQRDIIRCRLAAFALQLGDVAAGEAWLSDVGSRSVRLEVDTEYRLARAMLHMAKREYPEILEVLGLDENQIPMRQSDRIIVAFCLRAHALAAKGDTLQARNLIGIAAVRWSQARVKEIWEKWPGPSTPFAAEAARRSIRGVKISIGVGLALVISMIVVPIIMPCCMGLVSCKESGPLPEIRRFLNNCPEAREVLGENITWAVGCHNCQGGGGCDDCHWSGHQPVTGSKARADFHYSIRKLKGRYRIVTGTLRFNGKVVSLHRCKSP